MELGHIAELPEITVIEDPQSFVALEAEWDALYQDSPLATPFQSWAWLYSWWEFYGEGYELRLITVRNDEGLLVGIIPLMLKRRRWGFGRLLFLGTGPTDYLDMLARRGWEMEVAQAGAGALRRIGSWQVADLQELRPEAAAWGLFGCWNGPRVRVWQSYCPVIEARPWEELVSSLSKNLRSTVRRTLRRAEEDGVRRELADAADAKSAACRLLTLHRESRQGRDIGPEHLRTRFGSFISVAAYRMTTKGLGGISEFWRGEEVIIASFWISRKDFLTGTFLLGASQEALRRYQWSSLYIQDALNIALDANSSQLDLLRGDEIYKLRWTTESILTHRAILGRNPMLWGSYASYYIARAKARRYIKSESAPKWVKGAVARGRTLYHAACRRYVDRDRKCS